MNKDEKKRNKKEEEVRTKRRIRERMRTERGYGLKKKREDLKERWKKTNGKNGGKKKEVKACLLYRQR